MYYGKVEICGVNTAALKNLSDDEKDRLLKLTKEGDEEARQKLIDGNLRLVLSVIQRFAGRGENPDDLFQVGCVGLIKAVDNFDTGLDVKFSTYAVPMIIGEIRRYLRDNNLVRVSRSVKDMAYRAFRVKEELSHKSSSEPCIDDIVNELNRQGVKCKREDVVIALESIMEPVSLFEPVYNGDASGSESIYLMDQIRDEGGGDEAWTESIALKDAMKMLGGREKAIIDMRFYMGKTQMEIAEEIGISQAQVSRLEKGALAKIRKRI